MEPGERTEKLKRTKTNMEAKIIRLSSNFSILVSYKQPDAFIIRESPRKEKEKNTYCWEEKIEEKK